MMATMKETSPIDLTALSAALHRHAGNQHRARFFTDEIASRMLERLDFVKCDPGKVLLLAAEQSPHCLESLRQRYPTADFDVIVSPHQSIPLDKMAALIPDHYDLIVANLVAPWVITHPQCLLALRFAMRANGLLFFTTVGPDSLRELKQSTAHFSLPRVYEFIDMHHIGDALLAHRWQDPVMDMETLTLQYPDLPTLVNDLRSHGVQNFACERVRGLTGKSQWQQVERDYAQWRNEHGLPVTAEIIYGHAWAAGDAALWGSNEQGEVVIPVASIK